MKKYIIIGLIVIAITAIAIVSFGCVAKYAGSDTAVDNDMIVADFNKISGYDHLYYAKDTKIVYWIGGSYNANIAGDDYTTSYMSAWFAENGKPYRFNEATGQMEMID